MTQVEQIRIATGGSLFKAGRTDHISAMGPFVLHVNRPGRNIPGSNDHGYGPLAAVIESTMAPGTVVRMHEHANDEIISWVPAGVMRHMDRTVGALVTDPAHLMVMNAGRSFWHEEETLRTDPFLRMLQIFVRPHTADLEPKIQHGPILPVPANEWRYLFGPEGSDAPFTVRNEIRFFDIRLDEGAEVKLPQPPAGWDTYFYVFEGEIFVSGTRFGEAESGLLKEGGSLPLRAAEASVVVVFLIDPAAEVVRRGTIGR
ncbi:MAG: conserved pirin domain protein [Xanthobacteraceae bacterium]|jgi:redox-sensitive bicupin YhaK (pirin superfamily)|nr:conserved pirin domain protein [Xanthobacteraceae bacterium]